VLETIADWDFLFALFPRSDGALQVRLICFFAVSVKDSNSRRCRVTVHKSIKFLPLRIAGTLLCQSAARCSAAGK
jgi:hypothetical protein